MISSARTECRAFFKGKAVRLLVVQIEADHVRRQDIRCELDALAGEGQRFGERQCQRGLADAGHVLQQDMPAREDRKQDLINDLVLSVDRLADFREHLTEHRVRGLGRNEGGVPICRCCHEHSSFPFCSRAVRPVCNTFYYTINARRLQVLQR